MITNRIRTWRLKRRGLTTGEFDQLEQFANARGDGIQPGDLISKPATKRLEERSLVNLRANGRRVILGRGMRLWLDVRQTPRRGGNWLNVW